MINKTLVHYTIIEKLGAGGMGEVYRAEDTKLDRHVAIKMLPEVFEGDPERLARFEREAKVLASLNHPNIAAIHGLEEAEGKRFLVMELVEGETLDQKLEKGAFSIEDSLDVCQQIAEGIEAAHEKDIIHRDLKPANVKVTDEGKVKVLDFGLAKALQEQETGPVLMDSPTLTAQMTQPGVILGTAPYMSPEQAKGKAVDKRTDIWAFGCILYECLTGRRAFKGDTVSETMASILKDEPDWGVVAGDIPAAILRLMKLCLRKDPRQRLQSIGDARIEFEENLEGAGIPELSVQTPETSRFSAWWLIAVLGLVAVAGWILGILGIIGPKTSHEPRALTRFTIELPVHQQIYNKVDRPSLVISNDGQRIAWIGNGEDERQVYTRPLESLEVKALDGTRGLVSDSIAISPDGRWIAFSRDNSLWKVPFEDGPATPLLDTSGFQSKIGGLDWGEEDKIVIVSNSVLYLYDLDGSPPIPLTQLQLDSEIKECLHYNPRFLPGGKAVVFANCIGTWNNYRLEAVSLETLERNVLVDDAYSGYATQSGHLLFGRNETIFAVPFDADRLKVTGPETPILSSVQMNWLGRIPSFAVSPNGTMAYTPGDQGILKRRFVWFGRNGEKKPLSITPDFYMLPELSPDATEMAVDRLKGHYAPTHTYDFDRDLFTQLIFDGDTARALWSPDGSRLFFQSDRSGHWDIYAKSTQGSDKAVRLTESPETVQLWSCSKDGRLIAYSEWVSSTFQYDLWFAPVATERGKPIPFIISDSNENQPRFSPNGRWIAYMSNEEGQPEIFVQDVGLDGSTRGYRRKASRQGGHEPRWAPDGKELYFRSLDGLRLLAVQIEGLDPESLRVGEEKVVLDDVGFPTSEDYGENRYYDVHPDGQKFLVMLEDLGPERAKFVVVQNWLEELKRKMSLEK
jgi:serine/threonine protein kinase